MTNQSILNAQRRGQEGGVTPQVPAVCAIERESVRQRAYERDAQTNMQSERESERERARERERERESESERNDKLEKSECVKRK